MPVFERETIEKRTPRDVARHQEKIEEAIKEKIWEIIAREDIITESGKRKVRVSVKFMKSYYFKYENQGGEGEGEGEGDEPGDQPGDELYDTEIDIEKLIEWALEECGLPNLEDKKTRKIVTSKSYKYEKIDFVGIKSLQDKRLTIREAVKRQKGFVARLRRMTNYSEKDCENILAKANGELHKAIEMISKEIAKIIKLPLEECRRRLTECKQRGIRPTLKIIQKGRFVKNPAKKKGKIFIQQDDERYRMPEEKVELHSNAVIFALRDASGSMDDEKKFLSRIMLFWIVEALRKLYEHVEIRFALHTTEAELVNEHDFFYRSESGGTFGGSGYKLFQELEKTQYPSDEWNVYTFHFSDGEDFQPESTVQEALKLLKVCQMLGYGEIQLSGRYNWSDLMGTFQTQLAAPRTSLSSGIEVVEKMEGHNLFVGVVFSSRTHILPVLKEFLKQERGLWE